jgi:hypothetical protein
MITYEKILKKPQVLNELIGMSLAEFEKLYARFEHAHAARLGALQYTRRTKGMRLRVAGAGPKHKYALRDRLLMTLFWLRAYTTYKVLGTLYNLNKTTVEEYLKSVIHTLSLMSCFDFERPHVEIPKLRSVQEVLKAFPELLLFIDPEEHSVE